MGIEPIRTESQSVGLPLPNTLHQFQELRTSQIYYSMFTRAVFLSLKDENLLSRQLASKIFIMYRCYFSNDKELEHIIQRYRRGEFDQDHGPELSSDPTKTPINDYAYHQFQSEGYPPIEYLEDYEPESGFVTAVCDGRGGAIKIIKCTMEGIIAGPEGVTQGTPRIEEIGQPTQI